MADETKVEKDVRLARGGEGRNPSSQQQPSTPARIARSGADLKNDSPVKRTGIPSDHGRRKLTQS
jgi:hypothetical protein